MRPAEVIRTVMRSFACAAVMCAALWPLQTAAQSCAAPPDLGDGWKVAAPQTQGLDAAQLCAIGPRFDAWAQANAHAVLVVRNGVLVYERYFTGEDEKFGERIGAVAYDAGKLHDVRSVTKSIVSVGIGIAIARGLIASVNVPVFSLFPEYADLRTPEKDAITVQHLLTMSAGLAWNENVPYSDPRNSEVQMYGATDPIRYVLSQPLATPPGRVYNYNGGLTTLLAAIVKKAGGRPFDQFLQEALFEPLGVSEVEWIRNGAGDPWPASGLRLRPRDLAKIGQLVLSRGEAQGRQIVPAAWIDQSITPQINGEGMFYYGYQWWLGRTLVARQDVSWAVAVGLGGQRMFVVPSKGLVVVVHAGLYRGPIFQGTVGNTVLNGYVLPALQP
jgi:CubicO group peptidase (beta-lactamase class C family)